jgi:hypothetical protein
MIATLTNRNKYCYLSLTNGRSAVLGAGWNSVVRSRPGAPCQALLLRGAETSDLFSRIVNQAKDGYNLPMGYNWVITNYPITSYTITFGDFHAYSLAQSHT